MAKTLNAVAAQLRVELGLSTRQSRLLATTCYAVGETPEGPWHLTEDGEDAPPKTRLEAVRRAPLLLPLSQGAAYYLRSPAGELERVVL